jgi:hypothetical protein
LSSVSLAETSLSSDSEGELSSDFYDLSICTDDEDDPQQESGNVVVGLATSAGVPAGASLPAGNGEDQNVVDMRTVLGEPKRVTQRQAFEVIKAVLLLTDSQCTKMLRIWKNLNPVEDWKTFVTDGRYLAPPRPAYLRQLKLRRVVCGLQKKDFVPFHKKGRREAMLRRFEETGTTIAAEDIKHHGDIVDFDIEKSLLMESPGLLNPKLQETLLERVNAARPNLLSPAFLKIVDEQKWNAERVNPNPSRPKMNLFSVKFHSDGCQIAKNSVSSECTPLSFAIDGIFPYDPVTKEHDEGGGLVVPSSMSPVHTVSIYHGRKACCLFEFGAHWTKELERLNPASDGAGSAGSSTFDRRLVLSQKMMIADAVERSKRAGTKGC